MVILFDPEEMLTKGLLQLPENDMDRLDKLCEATKISDFKTRYGVMPEVAAAVWKDLQDGNCEHTINPKKVRTCV